MVRTRSSGGKAASAQEVAAEAGGSTRKRAVSASEAAAEAGGSTRNRKASSAAEAAVEAGGATRKRKASASEAAVEAGGATRKRKASAASEDAAEVGGSKAEERMIQRRKKEEQRRKREEQRMIQRLKKEEGKILELKKVANEANDEAMANLPAAYRPEPKAVDPAGRRKKLVMVRRVVAQEKIDALLAMPSSVIPNVLSAEQLATHPQALQDLYNEEMKIAMKLRDYHQGLVDQYYKYGYAVDESEVEVTDDEGEDDN